MSSKTIHLSRLSNQQFAESESPLSVLDSVSGERCPSGSYMIQQDSDCVVLDAEAARRIADHIQETDDHDN